VICHWDYRLLASPGIILNRTAKAKFTSSSRVINRSAYKFCISRMPGSWSHVNNVEQVFQSIASQSDLAKLQPIGQAIS
jgi:hypothetical protein